MRKDKERVLAEATYYVINASTIRDTAYRFKTSKSTVHRDFTILLPNIDKNLYEDVKLSSDKNKAEKHIRGGLATKLLYRKKDR